MSKKKTSTTNQENSKNDVEPEANAKVSIEIQADENKNDDDNSSQSSLRVCTSPRDRIYTDPKTLFVKRTSDNQYILDTDSEMAFVTRRV